LEKFGIFAELIVSKLLLLLEPLNLLDFSVLKFLGLGDSLDFKRPGIFQLAIDCHPSRELQLVG
jgi:hypothetical protein